MTPIEELSELLYQAPGDKAALVKEVSRAVDVLASMVGKKKQPVQDGVLIMYLRKVKRESLKHGCELPPSLKVPLPDIPQLADPHAEISTGTDVLENTLLTLREFIKAQAPPPPTELTTKIDSPYLLVPEAAAYARMTEDAIYGAHLRGQLKASYGPRNTLRFTKEALDKYLSTFKGGE
jgi:hypothetical protein